MATNAITIDNMSLGDDAKAQPGEDKLEEGLISLELDSSKATTMNSEGEEMGGRVAQQDDELPVEMQVEEWDPNDPNMDPLEWTARKLIPFPKVYFWETGNHDLPARTKAWHRTVAVLGKLTKFVENTGKSMNMNNASNFSYVTDTMTEEQWARARETAEQRKKERTELNARKLAQQAETEASQDIGAAPNTL
jgi:hypothetical protein|mmetsp:Transcript_10942/g.19989  ORF Transcript_10942/g.19989 Transcript_10942/m.19989 type:complete len:193 (-) Transcript_10942:1976-2554(-)